MWIGSFRGRILDVFWKTLAVRLLDNGVTNQFYEIFWDPVKLCFFFFKLQACVRYFLKICYTSDLITYMKSQ